MRKNVMRLNCLPGFAPCASVERHIGNEGEEENEEGNAVPDGHLPHVFPAVQDNWLGRLVVKFLQITPFSCGRGD